MKVVYMPKIVLLGENHLRGKQVNKSMSELVRKCVSEQVSEWVSE